MEELIFGGTKTWTSYVSTPCFANAPVNEFKHGYILRNEFLGYQLYILNGCAKWNELNELVINEDIEGILNWSDELVIKVLTEKEILDLMKKLIKKEGTSEYKRGYRDAQARIRNALGLS